MVDIDSIVYSTRLPTLGERILMQRVGQGDWEAVAQYIMARTTLQPEQILALDEKQVAEILGKINEGVNASITLDMISRSLDA